MHCLILIHGMEFRFLQLIIHVYDHRDDISTSDLHKGQYNTTQHLSIRSVSYITNIARKKINYLFAIIHAE